MAEYQLAHVGINAANADAAQQAAVLLRTLFGFVPKEGNSSIFSGAGIELMKSPFRGTHGHIAIGTPDVAAARAELEAQGVVFDPSTAKYTDAGVLNAVYLKEELCGFAIHLVAKAFH